MGDALLSEVGQRITQLLAGQGLVSRLANDQFTVMLLRPASRTELAQLAASLVEGLAQPWELSEVGAQYMGASLGISLYPDDSANSVELVRHAHSALHATKSAGRGSYRFYIEEFTQITRGRLELRRRLHNALQAGEFALVFVLPLFLVNVLGLGIMAAGLDEVMPYVRQRRQFGQPIGNFQLMQGKIADMYVALNTARAYVYEVARACDAGRVTRQDAAGAVLYASEQAMVQAWQAMQRRVSTSIDQWGLLSSAAWAGTASPAVTAGSAVKKARRERSG